MDNNIVIVSLNMYQTLAVAVIALFVGKYVRKAIPILETFCIPIPVVGGVIFAILSCIFYSYKVAEVNFDSSLRELTMVVFFTSVGFNANIQTFKKGGKDLIKFVFLVIILILAQNFLALGIAKLMGLDPLFGLASGSIPMLGGHGTAGAFGPELEKIGLQGGSTICIAAATFGLVAGSLIGGPLGRFLINKYDLLKTAVNIEKSYYTGEESYENKILNMYEDAAFQLIIAMGFGTLFSFLFQKMGLTFPIYIGSMLAAAIIRNVSEYSKKFSIYMNEVNNIGDISLSLFLGVSMISLHLWLLASLAVPLIVLLTAQVLLMACFAFGSFFFLGKNYDAAVMSSGMCGFGLGATPNAMANMQAVCNKYVPSVKAFIVIPLVGSLFVDFLNSFGITMFMQFVK